MSQSRNQSYKDMLQGLGILVGVPYAVLAAVHLSTENITSIPFIGKTLAACLPLGFYQFSAPIFIIGTFANYYSNLGSAIDAILKKELSAKNAGHVTGAIFGTVLTGTFIYFNQTTPAAAFSLPFGADTNVANTLLILNAPLYVAGACSNIFSHLFEGTKNTAVGTKKIVGKFSSGVKTLCTSAYSWFSQCRTKSGEETNSVQIEQKKDSTLSV